MQIKTPKKIKGQIFKDNRGFFQECFKKEKIKFNPVFSALSFSKKNVIRGLHLQLKKKQKIFITVLQGKILDICVDVNIKSKDFGKIFKNTLNSGDMLYIPTGYAHGFAALEKENLIMYQFSEYRHENSEIGILHNDKHLNIKWRVKKPIQSKKDKNNISFEMFKNMVKKK
jgi:dTDP-4-dehydrorhamnose 3,5-epimerase